MNRSEHDRDLYTPSRLSAMLPGTANVHARLKCLDWEWSTRPERGVIFLEPPPDETPMVFIFSTDREVDYIEFGYWEESETPPYGKVSTDRITPAEAMALLDEWEAKDENRDRPPRSLSYWGD